MQPRTLTIHANQKMLLESLGKASTTMQGQSMNKEMGLQAGCAGPVVRTPSMCDGKASLPEGGGAEGFPQGTQLSCPRKSERIPNGREEREGCQEGGHQQRLGRQSGGGACGARGWEVCLIQVYFKENKRGVLRFRRTNQTV